MSEPPNKYELQAIDSPEWGEAGRVHDWRNYVSEAVRALWPTFNAEQRLALYRQADELADNEHWD